MALHILYWLTQQFLYFLSKRKFSQNPLLPAFSTLLQHLHTKMLDGFLGQLLASWLEQVVPSLAPPSMPPASHGSWATQASHDSGNPVTKMNYIHSLRKHWQASGHGSITQLLQAHTSEGTPPMPMMGDQVACLSWLLRGCCFDNCSHISTHKQASAAVITQVHTLLDACGMAPSN